MGITVKLLSVANAVGAKAQAKVAAARIDHLIEYGE